MEMTLDLHSRQVAVEAELLRRVPRGDGLHEWSLTFVELPDQTCDLIRSHVFTALRHARARGEAESDQGERERPHRHSRYAGPPLSSIARHGQEPAIGRRVPGSEAVWIRYGTRHRTRPAHQHVSRQAPRSQFLRMDMKPRLRASAQNWLVARSYSTWNTALPAATNGVSRSHSR